MLVDGDVRVAEAPPPDDVPELRQLLRIILEEDPDLLVVGETGNAEIGIEEIAELQPNVVLLDLSMPGMDGLEALPLIRRAAPGTSVIVASTPRLPSAAMPSVPAAICVPLALSVAPFRPV